MGFIEIAKKRYSTRQFLDQPVEKEKILSVLEAGRIAPSAANRQPWIFIVIQDKEKLNGINKTYQKDWLKKAPVVIVICGDHHQSWIRSDGKDHCDIDIAISVDHMTLAAADIGLGTCWICAFDKKKCAEILNLPDHIEPIVLLPLGYPADKPDLERHGSKRKSLSKITKWESYS